MKDFQIVYMWNCILRAVAFICITVAAIHFGKISILFFYLVPMFMGIEYKDTEEGARNESKST